MSIISAVTDVKNDALGFITENKSVLTVGTGALVAGGLVGAGAVALSNKRKARKRKSRAKTKRKRNSSYKKRKSKKHTKRTSHKRIRYTKKGQPYIIKANGRAQFIKKKSAKLSRKRKGGRY